RRNFLFIDITDVILYFHSNSSVNGIQRVILNFIRHVLSDDAEFSENIRFCRLGSDKSLAVEIRRSSIHKLVAAIDSHRNLRGAINECKVGEEIQFQTEDIFLILGAFWIAPNYDNLLARLQLLNVRIGLFVYDLIPITHSQFVHPRSASDFQGKCARILSRCDFALAISQFVADEVAAYVQSSQKRSLRVVAVPLAHELSFREVSGTVGASIRALAKVPYVLCVSSLDPRKNQDYLVQIWQRLRAERGNFIPKLVLVGRWGWGSKPLADKLKACHNLDSFVEVLTSVDDGELTYLYQNCQFTVLPSKVEGWGLPIGESLAHGKPCFASKSSSMPEVGGEYVRYFDPFDSDDGFEKIIAVLDDPAELANWALDIANNFSPRSWKNFTVDLLEKVWEAARRVEMEMQSAVVLPCAKRFEFGLGGTVIAELGPDAKSLQQKMLVAGWGKFEPSVCWSDMQSAKLKFRVEGVDEGTPLRVAMQLHLPAALGELPVVLHKQGHDEAILKGDNGTCWYVTELRAGKDGSVDVALRVKGLPQQLAEIRHLVPGYFGLMTVFVAKKENLEERFLMLEAMCD
ncbi:MAG: glycosyltransferase family 4 protein, partial [Hyphomicrobiales bacterium]|nr:glycosyltransferase family 4 protein [Hyphomicrobiales bacterium]